MKRYLLVAIAASFVTMSSAPAMAGAVGVRPAATAQNVERLEQAREKVNRDVAKPNVRGPLLVSYMTKKARLNDLIERIKSGQSVSPEEIDQALAR